MSWSAHSFVHRRAFRNDRQPFGPRNGPRGRSLCRRRRRAHHAASCLVPGCRRVQTTTPETVRGGQGASSTTHRVHRCCHVYVSACHEYPSRGHLSHAQLLEYGTPPASGDASFRVPLSHTHPLSLSLSLFHYYFLF